MSAASSERERDKERADLEARPSAPKKKSTWLPDWIVDNVTNVESLKVLLRCWLAAWAGLILILPGRSLRVLGQAAFFSSMLVFMVPPVSRRAAVLLVGGA